MFKRKYLLLSFLLAVIYLLISHLCFYGLISHTPTAGNPTADMPFLLMFPASVMFVAGYSGGYTGFTIAGISILCIAWLLLLPLVYAVHRFIRKH